MATEKFDIPKTLDLNWVKAFYLLIGGACVATLFVGTTNLTLNEVQRNLGNITTQVSVLSDKINIITITTGRIEEHFKDIDRRLDILESRNNGFSKP